MVKNLPAMLETLVGPLGGEDPWRRAWQPTPMFLPGKSHGRRGLGLQSMDRGAWGLRSMDRGAWGLRSMDKSRT